MKTLKNLFLEELADRYDSEKQLVQAMPKMAENATCNHLKKLMHSHLKQTEAHVTEVEKVFKAFGEKPHTEKCLATVGLLKEGDQLATHYKGSPAINAALVSTAQKIEHYEIASYGCLHEWAIILQNQDAADILEAVLDQEHEANKLLIDLAVTRSNKEALGKECTDGSCDKPKTDSKTAPASV